MFVLNTSRPLFRNNPKLRQAVNFAVDRRALTRELGPLAGDADRPVPAAWHARLQGRAHLSAQGPDLSKARALAKGHMRAGKAVLYTHDRARRRRAGADPQAEPEGDRARGRDQAVPRQLLFEKLRRPASRSTSAASAGWHDSDPRPQPASSTGARSASRATSNWSYFNSPKYNRLLDGRRASPGGALPRLRRARRAALEGRCARDSRRDRSTRSPSSPRGSAASS